MVLLLSRVPMLSMPALPSFDIVMVPSLVMVLLESLLIPRPARVDDNVMVPVAELLMMPPMLLMPTPRVF